MKRSSIVLIVLIAALLMASMLAGCGSPGNYSPQSVEANTTADSMDRARFQSESFNLHAGSGFGGSYGGGSGGGIPQNTEGDFAVASGEARDEDSAGFTVVRTSADLSQKIIYTVRTEIETIDFDASVELVYSMLDEYGAFIENSHVGGRNHAQTVRGVQTFRQASFDLRVPRESLSDMTRNLNALGNVLSTNRNAENITAQFIDTESRVRSLRIQESRFLDMMERSRTVTEMLEIERHLTEVRFNIESLTSTLQNWQARVDFSTLSINLYEVEELTLVVPDQPSYWARIGEGASASLVNVVNFFTALFSWVLRNSPYLFVIALLGIAVLIPGRRLSRRAQQAWPFNRGAAVPDSAAPPVEGDAQQPPT